MVKMHVLGLTIDEQTKNPVVILKETNGEAILPILVGAMEAMCISLALGNERLPRPLTHDLLLLCLTAFKSELLSIEISEFKDGIYYALLILQAPEGRVRIDCRPSDAIALALRANVAILVNDDLLLGVVKTEDAPMQKAAAHAPDAATDMARKVGAQKEMDILNGVLIRQGCLPKETNRTEEEKFLELLRELDPVSRQKM